jgi:hypothetical protein
MSEAVQNIKYAYDPDGAETRFMYKRVFGQWRSLIEVFGVAIMLLFVYLIVKIAMREYGETFAALHPAFVKIAPMVFWGGIVLGLAAAYLCALLVARLHQTVADVDRDSILYKKGPIEVTLDRDGIHTKTEHSAEFVTWNSVRSVVTTTQGLGLRLDNEHFIPVIDAELPAGTTRDDVLRAIDNWRDVSA